MADSWTVINMTQVQFLLNPPIFVGTQTAAQSVGNNTWVPININTTQLDSYAGHNNTSNSSRYFAQVSGWYTCNGVVCFDTTSSTGNRASRLAVNGSPVQGAASFVPSTSTVNATAIPTPTRDIFLNFGDYIEVQCFQSSGVTVNTAVFTDLASALFVRYSHQ